MFLCHREHHLRDALRRVRDAGGLHIGGHGGKRLLIREQIAHLLQQALSGERLPMMLWPWQHALF